MIVVKQFKHPDKGYVGIFIHFDQKTALKVAQSLLEMVNRNNCNDGRLEFVSDFSKDSIKHIGYLSIAAEPTVEELSHEVSFKNWLKKS